MTNDVVMKYNINIHHQAFSSLKDLCSTLREMYIVVVFGPIIPNQVQYVAGQIQSRQFGDK